nr:integrase, catalytic region, zinc finger, CCHC-type, peptidase aspartic, catalytic [Tanacetum cinerariifolium]
MSLSNLKYQHYHTIKDDGFTSKGKVSQGKKTIDTPVIDVDVSEESDSEPARKRTASRRVVKKKVIIFATANIIPDPYVTLELGKSISLTEAVEEESARQVHATHARIVTKSEPESAKKKTGSRSTMGVVIQDTPSAPKPKPATLKLKLKGVPDEEKVTSEENVILEWGSEQESKYFKEDQGDDEEVDWIDSDKYKEKKDDTDDEKKSGNGDEQNTDVVKIDARKTKEVKDDAPITTDAPTITTAVPESDTLSVVQTMHENKSFNKNPTNHALYHDLIEALIEDENVMDKRVADTVKNHKRQHDDDDDDDDEDHSTGPNQGKMTKRRRTKDLESSKKPSTTKETSKGEDVVRDDDQPQDTSKPKTYKTPNRDWFKQPLRPPTPNLEWNKHKLDRNNPEGDRYPFDMSKPLPLQGRPCHLTAAADYFFNNDMEFLKTSDPKKTYTTSITMTKVACYDIIEILGVKSVSVKKLHGYGHLEEIVVKRADRQVYKFKEDDFVDLHLNDIEDMLLLAVQHKLFHPNDNDIVEADDQAIQTILLGLPEDIYAVVDSCETAQEIWLRVQKMMKDFDIGIQEKKTKQMQMVGVQNFKNHVIQNAVQNPGVQNVGNQNGLIVVLGIANQNLNGNGNELHSQITKKGCCLSSDSAADCSKDFKSLVNKADESLAKHKVLELEIERLLRAVGLPKIDETHASSKPVTSNSVPTPQESKVVKNDNMIAPGMFRINPFKPSREEKSVPNTVRASFTTNPITVSQPHVITKKGVNSNLNGLSSIGVDNTDKTRRPQPRSNTKNDKVSSTSRSSCIQNKEVEVEEHLRNLLLSKNKKHMSSECNTVKLAIRNDKSEVIYAMCKQCLITTNHDVCVLNYVNDMNSHGTVRFKNDHIAVILGFDDLQWGNILITRVYFVEGLGHNLFSVGQFCDSDLQ